ncbi:hypothetical protein [Legionella sp. WA2022007384]
MRHNFLTESLISYYLKHIGGLLLTLLGIFGLILTSPLSLLGGTFGWLRGMRNRTDPWESGFKGIRIASLGSIDAIIFGIKLVHPTTPVLKSNEPKAPLITSNPIELHVEEQVPIVAPTTAKDIEDTSPTLKPSTVSDTFFSRTELKTDIPQATSPPEVNDATETQVFLVKVNQAIAQDEAQATIKIEDDVSNVEELYIDKLITLIKVPTTSKNDFWDRLEQMSNKDIKLFVSKLSVHKEKGRFSATELDYLWRQFIGFEFEVSKREYQARKLTVMLEAISDEQLKASVASADFLNVLNKDAFAASAVNTFTRKQLELFAADNKLHETLNSMIKKLQPGPYLLGKLVSIMPYASWKLRIALTDQISHMAHPASFKIELTKLVDHYIHVNFQKYKNQLEASQSNNPQPHPPTSLPTKKWASVQVVTQPVYIDNSVPKTEWSDEAFDAFISDLNSPTFITNDRKISADLDSLPDYRIKMLVERAASAAGPRNLLSHIWILDSKTRNHKSYIDCRENRLKVILEHMTPEQLECALKDNKFWEIFRNTQEPFCEMAARVLTPEQCATIIIHAPLERHADFAIIITQIRKDSPIEKERLQKILELITPHATPWVALALERQIKNLLTYDQRLFERLHNMLKVSLTQSLERPEVSYKYKRDRSLNRQAISYLMESHPHISSATVRF